MSLHCPARLLLAPEETLPAAAELGARLGEERLSALYAASTTPDDATIAGLARTLGLPVQATDGLDAADRPTLRAALESVADLHRGETVLVVVTPETLSAVPGLATDRRGPGPHPRGESAVLLLECGDDGWFLQSWPGIPTPVD